MNQHLHSIGVCSWSLQPTGLRELVNQLSTTGLNKVQLALTPLYLDPINWKDTAEQLADANIKILSGMFQPAGEDYTTPATIKATGGIISDELWGDNWNQAQWISGQCKKLKIQQVSFHCGFIPEDTSTPLYHRIVTRVRELADLFLGEFGGSLLLETGQEKAEDLLMFLENVKRDNVGVNFDPANVLLYNVGDPIEALKALMAFIRQVHIKDGLRPWVSGNWGEEVVVGRGEVNWPEFFSTLTNSKYSGNFIIEREAGTRRVQDIKTACDFIFPYLRKRSL